MKNDAISGRYLKIADEDLEKFEGMNKGVLVHGDREVLYANEAAVRILGFGSKEDLMNYDLYKLIPPEYKEIVAARIEKALKGEKPPPIIERVFTKDGREIILKFDISPVLFQGRVAALSVFTFNAEDKAKREALEGTFRILERIVEAASSEGASLEGISEEIHSELIKIIPGLGMVVAKYTGELLVEYAKFEDHELRNMIISKEDPMYEAVLESREIYDPECPAGKSPFQLEKENALLSAFVVPVMIEGEIVAGLEFLRVGYASFNPEDINLFRKVERIYNLFIRLNQMILHLELEKEKYLEMAMKDSLTGVYSRRFYDEWIKKFMAYMEREGGKVAVVVFDIDGLKRVNDEFGHLEGDKLLRDFARAVLSSIRGMDFLVRIGGDEFLLVLPEASEKQAQSVVNRVIKNIEMLNAGRHVPIKFSFGVTELKGNESIEEAVKRADAKMYVNKEKG